MKRPLKSLLTWQVKLGIGLVAASALVYWIHFLIFKDARHIFLYLIGDIAFLFIEVLFVTLIINQVLNSREKKQRFKKLNMVIGAFFSDVGTPLLKHLSGFDAAVATLQQKLLVSTRWGTKEFAAAQKLAGSYACAVNADQGDMVSLRVFLLSKRPFILMLLENPNLLEHEAFTDLLWAVTHLTEELAFRERLSGLPQSDLDHLSGDIKRAYLLLIREWIQYLQHLHQSYPYLFSLSVRTNPFDRNAQVIVAAAAEKGKEKVQHGA